MTKGKIEKLNFTTKQITDIVGIKPNTLHYYIENGAIVPDVDPGHGRGTQRLFSAVNVIEIVMIHKLMKLGLLKKNITQMILELRKTGDREKLIISPYPYDNQLYLAFVADDAGICKHFFAYQPDGSELFADSPIDGDIAGRSLRLVIMQNVAIVFDLTKLCLEYVVTQL